MKHGWAQWISASPSAPRAAAPYEYRADVDGLRAVAVSTVMLFHLGVTGFGGGWLGVDVFFVLSGFLITRLITQELETGVFSFSNFYARRARRIFPAFFFTVACTFAAACVIFDPVYLRHFAGEVVYALTGASNFFYWRDGSYFGIAEGFKPLLHAWSLGVEEQFYLVWPLLIVVTFKYFRRQWWLVLTAAFVVSLVLSGYYFYAGKERAVFFLLPARLFEFAIGAMLVPLLRDQRANRWLLDGALVAGLALIGYAVARFDRATPLPAAALVACIGTALAIFGGSSGRLRPLLANPLAVGIGGISYSLYLVHWPLIVFYKYHRMEPLRPLEQVLLCVASFAGAMLMSRFVERPFRNPDTIRFASKAQLGFTCTAAAMILLFPASILWAKGSLGWSGPQSWSDVTELEEMAEMLKQDRQMAARLDNPFSPHGRRLKLMVIGDSHAMDIAMALELNLGTRSYEYSRLRLNGACVSRDRRPWLVRFTAEASRCETEIKALKASTALADADYVFIANLWAQDTVAGFDEGLALLKSLTKARIVVVGQNAVFPAFDQSLRFLDKARLARLNAGFYWQQSEVDVAINDRLRRSASHYGLDFIDRQALICPKSAQMCHVIGSTGRPLFRDPSHWSAEGRKVFGAQIVEAASFLTRSEVEAAEDSRINAQAGELHTAAKAPCPQGQTQEPPVPRCRAK